ncbi:MAG: 2-isopropylmalate synthase [Candidatus Micrarchaeota archaeon]|nr:2-isopropylmalate synthase [Candidatus Micrarchaeota archaeon]MDE1847998.1 2-isopropylmalate synthase [Candidatus Micrarchaeota archaeon]MDE1864702.1 2-isopropylmalate synthase [Candidatus Micrarchaeota archaeon]
MNNAQRRIRILDSTLREGMQHPGVNLTHFQMVTIAKRLDAIGVDQIEIHGNVSRHHYDFARQILGRQSDFNAEIVVHCRSMRGDIADAISIGAGNIATYIGVSPAHLKKLGRTLEETTNEIVEAIRYVRERGASIRVTMEDATSASSADLLRICMAAQNAGVTSISIPDTKGTMNPISITGYISHLRENGITVQLDTHCHNDLNQAVANSFAAVLAGADQIHTTINGFGERCGIAPLEVISIAASTYGLATNVRTELLTELCNDLYAMTRITPPSTQAVVGRNAFSNTAGTHIHGITSNTATYLGLSPQSVGNRPSLVYGVLAGRRAIELLLEVPALRSKLVSLNLPEISGIDLQSQNAADEIFNALKGQHRNNLFTITQSEAELNTHLMTFRESRGFKISKQIR